MVHYSEAFTDVIAAAFTSNSIPRVLFDADVAEVGNVLACDARL